MPFKKKIPYYGKYNSISSIELSEDTLTYLVKRFNNQGKERDEIFIIPNKKKNTDAILRDYFSNVEEYLQKNKNKYTSYKNKKISIKKDFNIPKLEKLKNISKIGLLLSVLIILLAIITASSIGIYYIGFIGLIPSSTSLFLLNDISKDSKIKQFLNDYEEFELNLTNYQTQIDHENKNSLTAYNGLNKDKNKGNDLNLKKIRTLENKVA